MARSNNHLAAARHGNRIEKQTQVAMPYPILYRLEQGLMSLVIIAASLVVPCMADAQGTPEDEAAIRKIVAEGAAAFNRHELPKGLTTRDFDVVIPPGHYSKAGP